MKNHQAVAEKTSGEQLSQFDQFRGRMISPQACASELGVSEFTIHRWIREGKIKAVKLSARCTRIDGNSVADHMVASTFVPGQKEEQPKHLRRDSHKGGKHSTADIAGQA